MLTSIYFVTLILISLFYGYTNGYSIHSSFINKNSKGLYTKLHLKHSIPFDIRNKYKNAMKIKMNKTEVQRTNTSNHNLMVVLLGCIVIPIVYFSFEIFKYFLSFMPLLLFTGVIYAIFHKKNELAGSDIKSILNQEIKTIQQPCFSSIITTTIVDNNNTFENCTNNIIQVIENINHEIQYTDFNYNPFEVDKRYQLLQHLKHILAVELKDNHIIQSKLERLEQNIHFLNNRIKDIL